MVVEIHVAAKHPGIGGMFGPTDVFHVDVVDALREAVDEPDIVNPLVAEVAGVVVETEGRVVANRGQGALGGGDVKGDLRRVDLESEFDAVVVELVHDRAEAFGEIIVSPVDLSRQVGGERVEQMPDRGAGEAVDHFDAEFLGGHCGFFQLLGGALAHAFGITVTVDVVGQDLRVALVDVVTHRLADQVAGNGEALHAVFVQQLTFGLAVGGVGFVDFEVVAPAAEFDTVIAEGLGFFDDGFAGKVGPLAGEEGDGSCHGSVGLEFVWVVAGGCVVAGGSGV